MKLIKTIFVAAGGLALSALTCHADLTLNFAALPESTIQFNGSARSFQFNPCPYSGFGGSQWWITSESGTPAPTRSAIMLQGFVDNGPFEYGPVTTVGQVETALVTGPTGGLHIRDGSGFDLTGTVNWITVSTFGSIGGINAALTVNVTGLAYGGANVDLARMVTEAGTYGGEMNVSFQFAPAMDLSALSQNGGSAQGPPYTTSFSGSIAVPEPTTLIAGALLLLPFGASTLRFVRRQRVA